MRPLAEINVLNLGVNLPAPLAAARLCQLGATVVKVEPPQGDPMQQVRMTVVSGVARLDPLFAMGELVRLLHEDAVWEVRAQAAHALGLSGAPEIVADLELATEDPNEFVRTAAENALRLHERVRGGRSGAELEKGQSGVY